MDEQTVYNAVPATGTVSLAQVVNDSGVRSALTVINLLSNLIAQGKITLVWTKGEDGRKRCAYARA